MKTTKTAFLIILICATFSISYSQVAVNSDGSSPDASAVLDVKSNQKGLLIPRMIESDRTNIASPAQGLMVYQTDNTEGFYYYDGISWKYIGNEGNDLWTRTSSNTVLSNSTDKVGIGTPTPAMKLDIRGFAGATNMVSTIPLWQAGNEYDVTNTNFQDLSNCEAGFEPSIYEQNGNIEVKLVIRLTEATGTGNEFQLTAQYWNGTSVISATPISNTDSWTWGQTDNSPYKATLTSQWKSWNAGTNAWELHLNGKKGTSLKFNSAYLLVRPKQP